MSYLHERSTSSVTSTARNLSRVQLYSRQEQMTDIATHSATHGCHKQSYVKHYNVHKRGCHFKPSTIEQRSFTSNNKSSRALLNMSACRPC